MLGDVYKRQPADWGAQHAELRPAQRGRADPASRAAQARDDDCLLSTSDAADERSSVDLGGRRIITKKKKQHNKQHCIQRVPKNIT